MNDFNRRHFLGASAALLATSSLACAANADDEPPYEGMTIERNASVPLPDGGVLCADIFRPMGHCRYPSFYRSGRIRRASASRTGRRPTTRARCSKVDRAMPT